MSQILKDGFQIDDDGLTEWRIQFSLYLTSNSESSFRIYPDGELSNIILFDGE